jgi:hypothetical protein
MHAPNYLASDPLDLAARVADAELNRAIRWTEIYLQGLRDQLSGRNAMFASPVGTAADLMRFDTDHDLPSSRLESYRHAMVDPSPAAHPPVEPDSLDITLAEHTHLIDQSRELAASAMERFRQLHDTQLTADEYSADDDGHFDRQGHVEEARGL